MKKLFFMACFALMAATAANAQWYVGGNVSYDHTKTTNEETGRDDKENVRNTFGITPRVGYIFNDRWSAGLGLGYRFSKEEEGGSEEKQNSYSVNPFVRFNFLYFGPFSLAAEFEAGYGRTKYDPEKDSGVKKWNADVFEFKLAPVLQLDVSRHITLESRFNFFSVGYHYAKSTVKYESGDKTVSKQSRFDAGVTGDEIFTTGNITFGMIYKF